MLLRSTRISETVGEEVAKAICGRTIEAIRGEAAEAAGEGASR